MPRQPIILVALPRGVLGVRVGGISPTIRLIRQLRRVTGISDVLVVANASEMGRWQPLVERERLRIVSVDEYSKQTGLAERPTVCTRGDVVLSGDGLDSVSWLDPTRALSLVTTADGVPLSIATSPQGDVRINEWIIATAEGRASELEFAETLPLPPQRVAAIVNTNNADAVDAEIAASLGRPQDPNFPRLTKRRFSKKISVPIARLDISPNWVTTAAIAVGLGAAALINHGGYAMTLAGSLLLVFSRLLDDCDGEVARLTQRQSRFGEIYDISADITVYTAIFLAITASLHRSDPAGGYVTSFVVLVIGAALTTTLILGFVTDSELAQQSTLARRLETTSSGDFAYIFLLVAIVGDTGWFLHLSAIGSHIFWMILLVVILHHRQQTSEEANR